MRTRIPPSKVAVYLPTAQVLQVSQLVGPRKTKISEFVQHAVKCALENDAALKEMVDEILEKTGGPMTDEERAWAEAMTAPANNRQGRRPRKDARD